MPTRTTKRTVWKNGGERRVCVGVMGSARDLMEGDDLLVRLGHRLAAAIVDHGCCVITGATTGLPDLVARQVRALGGLSIGISPAASPEGHRALGMPDDAADVIVFSGFGLKGRNVINIRTSDIVIIMGGGIGTLNELTIAYDEGKVIGVLEGSGGVADRAKVILEVGDRGTSATVIANRDPKVLLELCLDALGSREADQETGTLQ